MTPIIKHPGGKRKIAKVVADLLGNPAEICEPFAGGLGVSLGANIRPAIIGEAIGPIAGMYRMLSREPKAFWDQVDSLPISLSRAEYNRRRRAFNSAPSERTPANYLLLNSTCFNGLARFNAAGHFTAAYGTDSKKRPLKRQKYGPQRRRAYNQTFEGIVCIGDWRPAVAMATGRGLPIYADPPYIGTFGYAGAWGIGHLIDLARALPVGALISERIEDEPRQESLLGEPQTAAGTLEAIGFERVHTWAARDAISAGERRVRAEGIWRKVRR